MNLNNIPENPVDVCIERLRKLRTAKKSVETAYEKLKANGVKHASNLLFIYGNLEKGVYFRSTPVQDETLIEFVNEVESATPYTKNAKRFCNKNCRAKQPCNWLRGVWCEKYALFDKMNKHIKIAPISIIDALNFEITKLERELSDRERNPEKLELAVNASKILFFASTNDAHYVYGR